jgi:flagellar biosynthesis/type III secretory pathway M-ring protein FliF/YscJ
MKKLIYIFFLLLISLNNVFAQNSEVEMADVMRSNGKIYVVVATLALVLLGFFAYLWMTDNKITKLEKEMRNNAKN